MLHSAGIECIPVLAKTLVNKKMVGTSITVFLNYLRILIAVAWSSTCLNCFICMRDASEILCFSYPLWHALWKPYSFVGKKVRKLPELSCASLVLYLTEFIG